MAAPRQRIEKLRDGMPYCAAKYGNELELSGLWHVSIKIDGIRYIKDKEGVFRTRGYGELHPNVAMVVPHDVIDFELFNGAHGTSMSLKANTIQATPENIFSLNPLDPRLVLFDGQPIPLTQEYAEKLLEWAVASGYEGIVARQNYTWIKFVPEKTIDVVVNGFLEGNGKHKGSLGALTTPIGRVGGGFSDEMRDWIWEHRPWIVGKVIEVKFREMTIHGKMRWAQFVRIRTDKTEGQVNV